jgi:hypothetical protein
LAIINGHDDLFIVELTDELYAGEKNQFPKIFARAADGSANHPSDEGFAPMVCIRTHESGCEDKRAAREQTNNITLHRSPAQRRQRVQRRKDVVSIYLGKRRAEL